MEPLRRAAARPVASRALPSYPRALAAASALLFAGCLLDDPSNEAQVEGEIAAPFQEDSGAAVRTDGATDAKPGRDAGTQSGSDARPDGSADDTSWQPSTDDDAGPDI
ncbi:MAG: hypothetical protein HYV09_32980 [Deltaproteobacteria bacterium]|nr:hypothetical protein [Deltaproteobacteria bacterium]